MAAPEAARFEDFKTVRGIPDPKNIFPLFHIVARDTVRIMDIRNPRAGGRFRLNLPVRVIHPRLRGADRRRFV